MWNKNDFPRENHFNDSVSEGMSNKRTYGFLIQIIFVFSNINSLHDNVDSRNGNIIILKFFFTASVYIYYIKTKDDKMTV